MTASYVVGREKKTRSRLRPAGAAPAAASIVTLLLTQDFSAIPALFDKWTPLMLLFFLGSGALATGARVREQKKP